MIRRRRKLRRKLYRHDLRRIMRIGRRKGSKIGKIRTINSIRKIIREVTLIMVKKVNLVEVREITIRKGRRNPTSSKFSAIIVKYIVIMMMNVSMRVPRKNKDGEALRNMCLNN